MKFLSGLLHVTVLAALVQFQLVLPVVSKAQEQSDLVERVLKKSGTVAQSFPLQQQVIAQCQIAAECERMGKRTALWKDTKDLIIGTAEEKRDELWMEFGKFKATVGDEASSKMVIEKIVSEKLKNQARRLYCQVHANRGDLSAAWELADAIEKRNSLRFYAMESVVLAAAKAGDTKLVAKASRSMDPHGNGLMKRKLLDLCFVAAEYRKNGKTEPAKELIASMAVFVKILEDPNLDSMVALLTAAIEEDDFEGLLRDNVNKLDEDDGGARIERAELFAALVDRLEVDELAIRLVEDYSDNEFGISLMTWMADRFADNGDRKNFDLVASKLGNSITVAKGLIRCANSLGNSGDLETASRYLASAKHMVDTLEPQIDRAERIQLKSMLMAHRFVYGNQDETQKLLASGMSSSMTFRTYLEILKLH